MSPADKKQIQISLFTPTYNRASTLVRLYQSLRCQDDQDFLWEIIDDGSTDNTREVVAEFINDNFLKICYRVIVHGGKHSAYNAYLEKTSSDVTVEIDSDDELLPNAISTLRDHWFQSFLDRENLFSIFYGCVESDGTYVGVPYSIGVTKMSFMKFNFSRKYRCEKFRTFQTRVLQEGRFDRRYVNNGNIYIPESVLFLRVSTQRLSKFYTQPLRIYHKDTESLMRNTRGWRWNIIGMAHALEETLNLAGNYLFIRRPILLIRYTINYSRFKFMLGEGLTQQIKSLESSLVILIVVLVFPVSKLRAWWP